MGDCLKMFEETVYIYIQYKYISPTGSPFRSSMANSMPSNWWDVVLMEAAFYTEPPELYGAMSLTEVR